MANVKPQWTEYPSHGVPAPECYAPPYSRENHLGDILGGDMSVYNWTLPNTPANKCVLRIRYNISTSDFDSWNISSDSNGNNLYVMREYFSTDAVTAQRGYQYQNNPQIQLFDGVDLKFQLAINTAQYGRVFQDRSFTFPIKQRPAEYQDREIFNLNVRGRRGNIVQVFPALEYDFVPNRLEISPNSYVHIQWIGSNTTPPGAGQGNRQIDRNNLLLLTNKLSNSAWDPFGYLNYTGLYTANLPTLLYQSNFLNLPLSDLRLLAASGQNTDPLLYNATAYFDLGPRLVTAESTGIYQYVSTRNNDFSNRDQKGRIIVQPFEFLYQIVGQNGYTTTLDDTTLTIPAGGVKDTVSIKFAKFTSDQLSQILPENGQNIAKKEKLFNSVYVIEPYDLKFISNAEIQVPFSAFDDDEKNVDVLQFEPTNGVYLKLPSSLDTNARMLKFQSDTGGVFVFVEKSSSPIWVIVVGIIAGLLVIVIIATVLYFKLNPNRYARAKDGVSKTKRSLFSRV
jgi:hypothetical protein